METQFFGAHKSNKKQRMILTNCQLIEKQNVKKKYIVINVLAIILEIMKLHFSFLCDILTIGDSNSYAPVNHEPIGETGCFCDFSNWAVTVVVVLLLNNAV